MKILFITPCIPTQSDGKRPYNFLSYLAGKHEMHLLAMRLPPQTLEDIRHIQEFGVHTTTVEYQKSRCMMNCALGLYGGRPFRVSWCKSPDFRKTLERVLAQNDFDIVHIDRMRMGQYAPMISAPVLLDFTDSLLLYLERSHAHRRKLSGRLVDAWELRTIPKFEQWLLDKVNASLVCSSIDAREFEKLHPAHKFDVIENAVDAERFTPKTHESNHHSRCVLTGTLFYFANVDSMVFYKEEILPLLRQDDPELESHIIGTRPTKEISGMHQRDGINIFADVPRMEDYLYQDDIYICPLRVAAGVRNKLLEAMAAGMPIVTTRLGAEGLDVTDGVEVLFAESPQEFADCVKRLNASPELRKQLGDNGRAYVLQHHKLALLGEALDIIYNRIALK
jgi:glycosyltransferase involved in cell wall biosynthesis